jgi:hypothetical protein
MNRGRFGLLAWLVVLNAATDPPQGEIKLLGLVSHGGKDYAVLDTHGPRWPVSAILAEGENDDVVSVTSIDRAKGLVVCRTQNATNILKLALPVSLNNGTGERLLNLNGVNLDTALEIYQMLSDRTVLRGQLLPRLDLTMISKPETNIADALAALTSSLATNGVKLKPIGALFAFAVPDWQAESLASIPPPPVAAPGKRSSEIPGRMMRFQSAELRQVLGVYQSISGRTVLLGPTAPFGHYTIHNATALTREEGAWTLEAMFQLSGMAVMQKSERLTVLMHPSHTEHVPPFDPRLATPEDQKLADKSVNLSDVSLEQLLKTFCEITGREAGTIAKNIGRARVSFRNETPLTRYEMIYALETLAALHGVAFVVGPDRKVGLMIAGEARKRNAVVQP